MINLFYQKIKPMLAVIGEKADLRSKKFYFEPKIDGARGILYKKGSQIRILNRRLRWIHFRYPELVEDAKKIKVDGIFDGEICILNPDGTPNFNKLQSREQTTTPFKIKLLAKSMPTVYYVFDILSLNEKKLTLVSLAKRKKILAENLEDLPQIKKILFVRDGLKLWRAVRKVNMEGVMAKKIDSPYLIGSRSKNWLKIKNIKTTDCVICGWTLGIRPQFASLVLGQYKGKELISVGRVGTGYNEFLLNTVYAQLKKLKTKKCPFKVEPAIPRETIWTKPELVAEVKYLEYSKYLQLRAPSFVRLRFDKDPRECVLGA